MWLACVLFVEPDTYYRMRVDMPSTKCHLHHTTRHTHACISAHAAAAVCVFCYNHKPDTKDVSTSQLLAACRTLLTSRSPLLVNTYCCCWPVWFVDLLVGCVWDSGARWVRQTPSTRE